MTASGWRKLALAIIVIWAVLLVRQRLHDSRYSNSSYSGDSGGATYIGDGSSESRSVSSDDEESSESDADAGVADGGDAGGGGDD
jgi:hypothetical protein